MATPNHSEGNKWQSYLDHSIKRFTSSLPPDSQEKLDYSPGSLQVVEDWLLERYADPVDVLHDQDPELYAGAILYIGETFCKNLECIWKVRLDDFDPGFPFPYQGAKVVDENSDLEEVDRTFWPEDNVLELLRDRTGDLLRHHLESIIDSGW